MSSAECDWNESSSGEEGDDAAAEDNDGIIIDKPPSLAVAHHHHQRQQQQQQQPLGSRLVEALQSILEQQLRKARDQQTSDDVAQFAERRTRLWQAGGPPAGRSTPTPGCWVQRGAPRRGRRR